MEQRVVGIGSREEQKAFGGRHAKFFSNWASLKWCVERAFLRDIVATADADPIIFYLGRRCFDDFMEIMTLAANGHGFGATTLLRSMYERAVTARHLHLNPDDATLFRDYHWIQLGKLLGAMSSVLGPDSVPPEKVTEVREESAKVRERYLVRHCDHCARTRVNHTWTKLNFVEMARRTGPLGELLVHAYYVPLEQSHSTLRSATNRLRFGEDGEVSFADDPARAVADDAFRTAHLVLLHVLGVQREHFQLADLEAPLEECARQFDNDE